MVLGMVRMLLSCDLFLDGFRNPSVARNTARAPQPSSIDGKPKLRLQSKVLSCSILNPFRKMGNLIHNPIRRQSGAKIKN